MKKTAVVNVYELAIYGQERAVEITASRESVFVSVGALCIEVDREEFFEALVHLVRSGKA